MNKFEQELQAHVNSKKTGHDVLTKKIGTWGTELQGILSQMEQVNEKFFKEFTSNMDYMDQWMEKRMKNK